MTWLSDQVRYEEELLKPYKDRIAELEQENADAIKHHKYLDGTLNELYMESDKLRSALEKIVAECCCRDAPFANSVRRIADQALKEKE